MDSGPAWDGARNLSDLGGLPTIGGGETKTGRVWRSAASEWLTETGWRTASADGLARVVDLRNDAERGRQPHHPVVDASAFAGIEVIGAPTEDPNDTEFLTEWGPWLDHPRSWAPNTHRYPEKFARVFTAIADSPGPVLIHCAGGADRTGMVVSMLLALADVRHDAIATVYETGFRTAAGRQGHGLAYDQATGEWVPVKSRESSVEELDEAVADRRPVLLDWLANADVPHYLLRAGVGTDRLDTLRHLLTG